LAFARLVSFVPASAVARPHRSDCLDFWNGGRGHGNARSGAAMFEAHRQAGAVAIKLNI
jgi:hypothetical protein